VGDALGVPVEFSQRSERDADPVRELRGFGTYQQPPGTWSDDSSLMLCSLHSLLLPRLDLADMGARFVRYVDEAYMTPHGSVFDIGGTTARSISRLKRGVSPPEAGGTEDRDNGNGSLMRIMPVALRFLGASDEEILDAAHKVSGLTHRHPRSQLACGYFCLLLRQLLAGHSPAIAYARTNQLAARLYQGAPWQDELSHFGRVLSGAVPGLSRDQISGGGYVVHTLEASIWCLLRHPCFDAAVFAAINLGDDTDTTACVTGALAGVALGLGAIPTAWRAAMARHDELADWFRRFAEVALQSA
jgi:ADP-ribosylglycohydrolase